MSQRMKSRYVILSVRLLSVLVVALIVWQDYKLAGHIAWIKDIGLIGVLALVNFANAQGRDLAQSSMQKYGLDPDRDEAQPARKAIDN